MYLVDTNVISEVRKRAKANKGVRAFFKQAIADQSPLFISVVTVGELRRGVELIRHRGDTRQAKQLERRFYPFHLMEQPMLGICSRGPLPVAATSFIASNRSRRTPGDAASLRLSSSRPRYCRPRSAL